MPTVLIDTDIAIDYLRGDAVILPVVNRLWKDGTAAVSVVSVYELSAGMRETEKAATMNFIAACTVLEMTPEIAVKGGELYRKYRAKGVTLASLDCLISATALVKGYRVATRNVKHYPEKGIVVNLPGVT